MKSDESPAARPAVAHPKADAGPRSRAAPQPTALEVNLQRTAVEVVIPPEQTVLLDITAPLYGVQQSTRQLLREINHRYIGWRQTLEDLHRCAMGDFPHYLVHEQAPQAIGVFCALYARGAEEATPVELRATAIRNYLYYLEKVVRESGDRLPRFLPALEHGLDGLASLLRRIPANAIVASPRLKHLARAVFAAGVGDSNLAQRGVELLAEVLRYVYTRWLESEDPAEWWRERHRGGGPQPDLPGPVAAISHGRMRACLDELNRSAGGGESPAVRAQEIFALPDNAEIERGYLDAASCLETASNETWRNELERIHWLIRVLATEPLAAVHEQALAAINRSYLDVLRGADRKRLDHFVHETFDILRRGHLAHSSTALNLVEKIGREILATGDAEWTTLVINEILSVDFPFPEFAGFTEEWQVRVNPAHVRGVRTYLALIEENPHLARLLLAALVVDLDQGGVFIADTDLFQKDVSKLLNSAIGPVYHQVKHLLRILPVYFSEIGAEGELRDTSTRIDEIGGRKDRLCHFLRKQCHVESNPELLHFIETIGHFWATGDRGPLLPYIPPELCDGLDIDSETYSGLHRICSALAGGKEFASLFDLDADSVRDRIGAMRQGSAVDREKVELLFRLRRLVGRKYELGHEDLIERLAAFHRFDRGQVDALRAALAEQHHEAALEMLLDMIEQLKEVILSDEQTTGIEDIYHKRHIAAGIPSMYGRYREEKFEAMGLTFRAESLADVLFEKMIAEQNLEYVSRSTLRTVAQWLRLALRALRADGCRGRSLATGTAMLEQALSSEGISVDQYINIFQSLSHSIELLIKIRFLDPYESVLERLLPKMLDRGVLAVDTGSDREEEILKISEGFLRGLIARSFTLKHLDHLVGAVLRTLMHARERLARPVLNLLMTFDKDRCCVEINREESPLDGVIFLGNKGYLIKRLAAAGFPVPHGFILTTEVFRCSEAIRAHEEVKREATEQIRRQVARLERLTGRRFGDPRRPLLLSVRSGSAISMPGMLDTFLNVGINEEIAAGLAATSGSAWAAWDAYRRFLQFWGMSHGIDRNRFDTLMREAKRKFVVAKKSHIPAARMRDVALQYRDLLLDQGAQLVDDPFEQLQICTELVLRSWQSAKACVYRREMQVADEWGTAVIVQNMVYGNLHKRSGTGVALTCDPHRGSGEVRLYGDFIVQGQGDDVVSGLVETFPLSEQQRRSEQERAEMSLEKDFPDIYAAMTGYAQSLIYEQGMFHQELEFTFESDRPEDLYILQTRDIVLWQSSETSAFLPGAELEAAKAATGIGVGRGVLSGRAAHTAEDIAELRRRFPDDPIILLRPDTVPDDVPLILQADGMVTAIGGATSHAAVAAQRLGRTCVVGCRLLHVFEEEGRSELAGHAITTGDFLSINGSDGSVYLGKHPSVTVHQHGLS